MGNLKIPKPEEPGVDEPEIEIEPLEKPRPRKGRKTAETHEMTEARKQHLEKARTKAHAANRKKREERILAEAESIRAKRAPEQPQARNDDRYEMVPPTVNQAYYGPQVFRRKRKTMPLSEMINRR